MESLLPEGCPFVIGGGLIRDALYGGCPSDIDIWLPSNISIPDIDAFCRHLATSGFGPNEGFQGQVLFRGPGATVQPVNPFAFGALETAAAENYGDVHNHWVVELQTSPIATEAHPRVNFMRNMATWNGDAESWFTEIMRNFDLDICMFFIGYMPGQSQVNTVIMPRHMLVAQGTRTVRMNEVYWNQGRLQNTSVDRILARVDKMNSKYNIRLPRLIQDIQMIPTENIVAVPVRMSRMVAMMNNQMGTFADPTQQNRMTNEVRLRCVAYALARYQAYVDEVGFRPGLNVMSFFTSYVPSTWVPS